MVHAAIVVPTIREGSILKFLESWKEEFRHHSVIVVEDNPHKTFPIDAPNVEHYSWEDIDGELNAASWIIPRRSDCVRSFGFLKAAEKKPDLVITLDDDCYRIEPGFVERHWARLESNNLTPAWIATGEGYLTRGFPYENTTRRGPAAINHGMWTKVPDYDAPTQLLATRQPRPFTPKEQTIPRGVYYPMCGMNVAFRPEALPMMYFLLMGQDDAGNRYPFDRFGDIWCGILSKRICDHLNWTVRSGPPLIEHQRASNMFTNLNKESPGLLANEYFWSWVDSVDLSGTTAAACYMEIAEALPIPTTNREYWQRLKRAMIVWATKAAFAIREPSTFRTGAQRLAAEGTQSG